MKITIITTVLAFCCVLLSEEIIVEYGQWLYFIQFVAVIFHLLKEKMNFIFFFSPSFITLAYLSLSFGFGHILLANGLVWDREFYHSFKAYESINFITAFILLCNLMVFLAIPFNKLRKKITSDTPTDGMRIHKSKILLFFVLLFLLSNLKVNLSFLGGHGDFSYVFKLATAIIIVLLVSNFRGRIRFLYYLLIVLFFVVGHYDSKREFLYLIILILFIEFCKNRLSIKIKLKQFVLFILGVGFIFYIVVIASIMRGYGSFHVNNPLEASSYVFEYLTSDYAISFLGNNFELTYVYSNSTNAIDYVYTGEVDLLYGSTFAKVLFLPVPRRFFANKPSSMIDIYTTKYAPGFREEGGSYPIVIYAESFWNFHLLALPFLFLIFYLLNHFYRKTVGYIMNNTISVHSVFLIFMYVTLIQFIRGSGFEIWLIYGLLSVPFIWLVIKIFNLRKIGVDA